MQRRKQSVELGRLELPTSCLQNKRSSRLNYNPKIKVPANIQPLIYKKYEWQVHKKCMLSSYILALLAKRLWRDLNPCYSTVTEWYHNQLGDRAKTRWNYFALNIPNITQHCCVHLNWGGRTRTYDVSLSRFYRPLPSPLGYSPSLLSWTAIL